MCIKNRMSDVWDDNEFPLAYLITIRTFGTWLHGDERNSVDRHGKNIYGTRRINPNEKLREIMSSAQTGKEFLFNEKQRSAAEQIIKEICRFKQHFLHAVNVRTNHLHVVVSAQSNPEKIINSFKTHITRDLRLQHLVRESDRIWSRGGSRRYLWKQRHVDLAIDYVLYCQDDVVFNID